VNVGKRGNRQTTARKGKKHNLLLHPPRAQKHGKMPLLIARGGVGRKRVKTPFESVNYGTSFSSCSRRKRQKKFCFDPILSKNRLVRDPFSPFFFLLKKKKFQAYRQ
jgi:hypothetical protein